MAIIGSVSKEDLILYALFLIISWVTILFKKNIKKKNEKEFDKTIDEMIKLKKNDR
jgi:hypothetical protein